MKKIIFIIILVIISTFGLSQTFSTYVTGGLSNITGVIGMDFRIKESYSIGVGWAPNKDFNTNQFGLEFSYIDNFVHNKFHGYVTLGYVFNVDNRDDSYTQSRFRGVKEEPFDSVDFMIGWYLSDRRNSVYLKIGGGISTYPEFI